ncbi:MAG: hypothetical protein HYS86_01600 [Candidatus Chisholmbacteria bacterium]|nr:hypothetical protein [Candidatus Chisholmbacteria bacterium]
MKWVTTNIRFPEDLYVELKLEAARRRTSLASIIRQKVGPQKISTEKTQVKKIMHQLEKLAQENSRQNPRISFSQKLIAMRYEQ